VDEQSSTPGAVCAGFLEGAGKNGLRRSILAACVVAQTVSYDYENYISNRADIPEENFQAVLYLAYFDPTIGCCFDQDQACISL
jgi:hypothetical protein